jgi:hypothetical protein
MVPISDSVIRTIITGNIFLNCKLYGFKASFISAGYSPVSLLAPHSQSSLSAGITESAKLINRFSTLNDTNIGAFDLT